MTKYRMSNGLAIMPQKDMNMLKQMSQQGWHLSGVKGMRYSFEVGQPYNYQYAVNFENNVTRDMLSIYEAAGWTPVVINDWYQIFRADESASSIFTDSDSEIEILNESRRRFGKYSFIFGCLLILSIILEAKIDALFLLILVVLCTVAFVFALFPFVGLSMTLRKKK